MPVDPHPPDHIKVEVAFASAPDDPAPTWTDITPYVELSAGITITRGRPDEYSQPQPGTCTLTLNNTDGRFTVGLATSPYYPNVKIRKKLRVSYIDPNTFAVSYRHTGYVEEWPVEWPNGGKYTQAVVTSVDRFKRLGNLAPLLSVIQEEILIDTPVAYYTLGESGGVSAGDTSGVGNNSPLTVAQFGVGGTLTFGANTGPGTDGLTAPSFVPASSVSGKYLKGTLVPVAGGTFGLSVEMFFNAPTLPPSSFFTLFHGSSGGRNLLMYLTNTSGHLVLVSDSVAGTDFSMQTTGVNYCDGRTHHVVITETLVVAFSVTATIYVDGVSVLSTSYTPLVTFGDFIEQLEVGEDTRPANSNGLFSGTISHVAVYNGPLSAARIAAHARAGVDGFAGERSDQRIARLASYAGIPTAEQSLEVGMSKSISALPIAGQSPLQAMQDVTTTENGVLFMAGDGRLTFQARSHRYNIASSLTISATDDLEGPPKFQANDAFLVNDVLASRAGGISAKSVNQASVTDYGTSHVDLALLTTSDNEVIDAASWRTQQGGAVVERTPNLALDLVTNVGKTVAVLAANIGDRITLNALPIQAPAASIDQFIEGWSESISSIAWGVSWNTTPASAASVSAWQLDNASNSVLGTTTKLVY